MDMLSNMIIIIGKIMLTAMPLFIINVFLKGYKVKLTDRLEIIMMCVVFATLFKIFI